MKVIAELPAHLCYSKVASKCCHYWPTLVEMVMEILTLMGNLP
jgi:hypothetical protein